MSTAETARASLPAPPPTGHRDITPDQALTLDAIHAAVASRGYPPTMTELAHTIGLSEPEALHELLGELVTAGHIRRDPHRPCVIHVHATSGATSA